MTEAQYDALLAEALAAQQQTDAAYEAWQRDEADQDTCARFLALDRRSYDLWCRVENAAYSPEYARFLAHVAQP